MDEIKIIEALYSLIKSQGLPTVLLCFFLWDKFIKPRQRKSKGEWVSWESLQKRLEDLEKTIHDHLEKEAQEDVRFAKMESESVGIKEMNIQILERMKSLDENFFKLVQLMIQQRNNK